METLSRWLQELAEVRCARVCRLAGCLVVVMQRTQAEVGVGHLGDGTAPKGVPQQHAQGPSRHHSKIHCLTGGSPDTAGSGMQGRHLPALPSVPAS